MGEHSGAAKALTVCFEEFVNAIGSESITKSTCEMEEGFSVSVKTKSGLVVHGFYGFFQEPRLRPISKSWSIFLNEVGVEIYKISPPPCSEGADILDLSRELLALDKKLRSWARRRVAIGTDGVRAIEKAIEEAESLYDVTIEELAQSLDHQ